jgi:hypothetical protein
MTSNDETSDTAARSLGFTEGWNAVTAGSGALPRPRRQRSRGRQLTDNEWADYKQGWAEAMDAYEIDEG